MRAACDPACAARQPSGLHRMAHGLGHVHGILGAGHGGGEQNRVATELHGQRRLGCRTDASIQHHGNACASGDQLNIVWVQNAQTRADRRTQRHDGGGPGLLEV